MPPPITATSKVSCPIMVPRMWPGPDPSTHFSDRKDGGAARLGNGFRPAFGYTRPMSAETTDLTGRARMASRLRRLREARGLTIQAVADRGGIAISTVSKIERNL
ncbi:MAG: helix-turn-helix domain-containing protein, partial [Pseudooceanicola nanhaiensis]